jgi:Glycosyltransferases involved in cell wall biogenesis
MKLSIVIPVKNQSSKLLARLRADLFPFFDKRGVNYEVLICSDASNEENQKILEDAMSSLPSSVRLLPYEATKGKGHAVKRGLLEAKGDFTLFLDADFATDLKAYDLIAPELRNYEAFIGSRNAKGAKILTKQGFLRRILHWGARSLVRMMYGLKVHDTQCGFKLFRSDIGRLMATHQRIDGFAFDAEYCYFLRLNGIRTLEVPVEWSDDPDSTVKKPLKTSWDFYRDLRLIKKAKKGYLLSEEEKKVINHVN